jgi:hypothetical protein
MASSGMLRRVTLVRTDVSEELSASIIRVTRIGEIGTTLAVTSNRRLQSASYLNRLLCKTVLFIRECYIRYQILFDICDNVEGENEEKINKKSKVLLRTTLTFLSV